MRRSWILWLAVGLCAPAGLLSMAWVSSRALEAERARAEARHRAELEERVRLSLWRMDGALMALSARESARPYFAWSAFHPAERAYTRMFAPVGRGDVLVPSPLLTEHPEHVLLHFQVDDEGRVTSPLVPESNMRDLAEASYTTSEHIDAAERRLDELRSMLKPALLASRLPEAPPPVEVARGLQIPPAQAKLPSSALIDLDALGTANKARQKKGKSRRRLSQKLKSSLEFAARTQNVAAAQQQEANPQPAPLDPAESPVSVGRMHPVWLNGSLVLARRVSVDGNSYVQAAWLDWPAIRESLLERVSDLLPDAELVKVAEGSAESHERLLAAIPARLVPGASPLPEQRRASPVRMALLVGWICVIVSIVALLLLLRASIALSERRAAFVSAVTHELRTPLTSFRLYTELLDAEMVPDEEKQRTYHRTLRRQAERLSHLVENVLCYARLERNPARPRAEQIQISAFLNRTRPALAELADRAGLDLVFEPDPATNGTRITADPSALERIVLNLVDNACKYAATAEDRRLHVRLDTDDEHARISVCDHGPGIDSAERKALFRAFSKSAQQAAQSAPGVGLGLALSRRLARSMRGELSVEETTGGGATFVLELPVVG